MPSAWQWLGGTLGGIGLAIAQERQQRMQEQLAAAQLLRGQGTYEPVSPEQAASASTGFQRFLGIPPAGMLNVGGQSFQFRPTPRLPAEALSGLLPGVELPPGFSLPMTPELIGRMSELQQSRQIGDVLRRAYEPLSLPPDAPRSPVAPAQPAPMPAPRQSSAPTGQAPAALANLVNTAAEKYGIDPRLYSALVATESSWNPRALSPKGAIGLAQLMPSTAAALGVDPYDMAQNVEGGARYLSEQLERFGGDIPRALAAYNAGPTRVAEAKGIPNIPETQGYVRKVMGLYRTAGGEPGGPVSTGGTPREAYIMRLNERIQAMEQQIPMLTGLGPKGQAAANQMQLQLNRLVNDRDKQIERIEEPQRKADVERAVRGVKREEDAKDIPIQALAKQAEAEAITPELLRRRQAEDTFQADLLTKEDRLAAGAAGLTQQQYSKLSEAEFKTIQQTKTDINAAQILARAQAQADVTDARDRNKLRRLAELDLRKAESVIDEVEQSFQRYAKASLLKDPIEVAKAGVALRTVREGFSPALARLSGERGVLTNQDREKAEALLPGITTPEAIGKEDIERLRRMIKGWKTIMSDVFGSSSAPSGTSSTPSDDDILDQELAAPSGAR